MHGAPESQSVNLFDKTKIFARQCQLSRKNGIALLFGCMIIIATRGPCGRRGPCYEGGAWEREIQRKTYRDLPGGEPRGLARRATTFRLPTTFRFSGPVVRRLFERGEALLSGLVARCLFGRGEASLSGLVARCLFGRGEAPLSGPVVRRLFGRGEAPLSGSVVRCLFGRGEAPPANLPRPTLFARAALSPGESSSQRPGRSALPNRIGP